MFKRNPAKKFSTRSLEGGAALVNLELPKQLGRKNRVAQRHRSWGVIQQDTESWSRIVTPMFCSLHHMVLNTEWTAPKLSWRTMGVKVGCTTAIVKLWMSICKAVNEHIVKLSKSILCAEEENRKPGWWVSCRPDPGDTGRVRRGHTGLE